MAHVAHAPNASIFDTLRLAAHRLGAFWNEQDGLRHASYISLGLFVALTLIKLAGA